MQSNEKSLSISHLIGLISQGRNEELKSIVSNANLSDLINIGGKFLMHTAATTSNIEAITFLFSSGFDINVQNELGHTPLHLASIYQNFQVVQLLLSLNANILIDDNEGISSLELCFRESNVVPKYITYSFLEILKRTKISSQQKANHLIKAGCTIKQALVMNDAEITGLMLDQRISIDEDESRALLKRAINSGYPENVKMLVKRGPGLDERLEIFHDRVINFRDEPKMKFYFEQLINWDVVTKYFIGKASDVFLYKDEDDMQLYFDLGIDKYVRDKFGSELLVELFGNEKVDCIKMIKNRDFNINGQIYDRTALYVAALYKNRAGMVYLLKNGADPNIKDGMGRTPLFVCSDDELCDLLLEAGADVQIIDNMGRTLVDSFRNDRITASICLLKEKGLLKQEFREIIENSTDFLLQYRFEPHHRDLEWMKICHVSESITLFTVLLDNVENTARYVKNEKDIEIILEVSRERKLLPIYEVMLTENLRKAVKMNELQSRAAKFLSNVMRIYQPDHLVIRKIIAFLTYQDLLVFQWNGGQ